MVKRYSVVHCERDDEIATQIKTDPGGAFVLFSAYEDLEKKHEAALRMSAQLQAELARWQTNCTGRHGSQMGCGFANDAAGEQK